MTKTLLAVDGNSLVHRAFHAYGPREEGGAAMRNSRGEPVYAVYGFLSLLAKICQRVEPSHLLVGFDDHTSSVRKGRWPHYKAQRESKGAELHDQVDALKVLLEELGVRVVVPAGLEADDVMASAGAQCASAGLECVIVTSDRDSFALISESTTVMRLVSGVDKAVMMTPEVLVSSYGVRPEQYLDYAALRGDASDNLPGVKGIGEKTAAKLLAEVGSVRAGLEDLARLEAAVGKSVRTKLEAGLEAWRHNLEVMEVVRDLDLGLARCELGGAGVASVLERAEMPSLTSKVTKALKAQLPAPAAQAGPGALTLF
jgi:DNA polymerase-1